MKFCKWLVMVLVSVPALAAGTAPRQPCTPPAGTLAIEFQSGGNTLRGFLDLPALGAKHPAIMMVLGGGTSDVTVDTYLAELRAAFKIAGIATLIWDKAGNGCSSGQYSSALPLQERATETLAALAMLKHRADIDPTRIGVWAFSQGGWVAPMAAVRSEDIAYLIVVNGSARDALTEGAYLSVGMLRAAGVSEREARHAYRSLRRGLAVLRAGGTAADSFATVEELRKYPALRPTFQLDEAGARQLQGLLSAPEWSYTGEEFLQQLDRPTLAIFGQRDTVMDWRENIEIYRAAFARSQHRDLTIESFEDADHTMFPSRPSAGSIFVPRYIETMTRWLAARKFTNDAGAPASTIDTPR